MTLLQEVHIYGDNARPDIKQKLRKIAEADLRSKTKEVEFLIERRYDELFNRRQDQENFSKSC
jgi:hypothetical protein